MRDLDERDIMPGTYLSLAPGEGVMATQPSNLSPVRFDEFELDLRTRELRRDGVCLKIQPQPAKVLTLLVSRAGKVVTRGEIAQEVWGSETFVDFEQGLNFAIRQIRAVLNDDADHPRFLQTLPKQGYRFIAAVVTLPAEPPISKPFTSGAGVVPESSRTRARRAAFWSVLAAAVVVVLLAAAIKYIGPVARPDRSAHSTIRSIAVLPLVNLSSDPEQEYFSDGLTDELITELAKVGTLRVISRTSIMTYKGTRKQTPTIARELHVDAIVEGTIERVDRRVRVRAQLINGSTDQHLWAEAYDRDLSDLLHLEFEVASDIARQVGHVASGGEDQIVKYQDLPAGAYEDYLRGRYFWNKRDPNGLQKALTYFQAAANRGPNYAPAFAGLADTYSLMGAAGYDMLPKIDAMEKAREAANRALAIDSNLAEAHASLGWVIYCNDWNWEAAEREFQRAIVLNPSYATAHMWYSEYLSDLGRRDAALAEAQTAVALDPLSLVTNHHLARAHYFARRFDESIEVSKRVLEMEPNFSIAHLRLGPAYAEKGMYAKAIDEFQEFGKLSGDTALATASIGNALARSGDASGAFRRLQDLTALSSRMNVSPACFALVHLGLGDKDQTFNWLEKAYQERSDFFLHLGVDPLFDPIRLDPRYIVLSRRMKLPQWFDRRSFGRRIGHMSLAHA